MGYNMFLSEYDSSGNTGFSYLNDDLKNTTVAKGLQGLTPLIGMKVSDEDESTTKSAIAEAKINIMNPDGQKQSITKLDRNTTKTLNALGKIFDKKEIEEKQEMATVFQDVWHTTVGDLVAGGNISKDQQRALNILGGAIAADLAGGSVGGALVGGATVELLQDSFSKITSPALRKVAVAIGAAIAAKGTGQEATAAANVAVAIETYNELTHDAARILAERSVVGYEDMSEEQQQRVIDNIVDGMQQFAIDSMDENTKMIYKSGKAISGIAAGGIGIALTPAVGGGVATVTSIAGTPIVGVAAGATAGVIWFVDSADTVRANVADLSNIWNGTSYDTSSTVRNASIELFDKIGKTTGTSITGKQGALVYDTTKVLAGIHYGLKDLNDFGNILKYSKSSVEIITLGSKAGVDAFGIYTDGQNLFKVIFSPEVKNGGKK